MQPNPPPVLVNPDPLVPILANIPHASTFVPERYRSQFVLSPKEFAAEQAAIIDWFTDELYEPIMRAGGSALIAPVSRLVLDTERYSDDEKEVMAKRGVGVIYERTTQCKPLRKMPSHQTRSEMIRELYEPYHGLMEKQTTAIIKKFGQCIILDCHSYPQHALPYELRPEGARPQICFGTDELHTPDSLIEDLCALTSKFGWSVELNTPFAGTMLPLRYYRDARVSSVMLEVRRDLYMDELRTLKIDSFGLVQEWVEAVTSLCARNWVPSNKTEA